VCGCGKGAGVALTCWTAREVGAMSAFGGNVLQNSDATVRIENALVAVAIPCPTSAQIRTRISPLFAMRNRILIVLGALNRRRPLK